MRPVVTRASTVRCQHGGLVATADARQRWVYVQGSSVMCNGDPAGLGITGCPTPNSGGSKPCGSTTNVERGESAFVFVDGAPVLLSNLSGSTNGVAPTPRRDLAPSPRQQYQVDAANQDYVRVSR